MRRIKLTQDKYAIVDDEDFYIVNNLKWHAIKTGYNNGHWYAKTQINKKQIFLHNFIINPPDKYEVDHKDGNGLNNFKSNLRCAFRNQNCWNRKKASNNTTGFKGVIFHKKRNIFQAQIYINKKNLYLGAFDSAEEAAMAYDKAASIHFSEFAKTNRMLGLLK